MKEDFGASPNEEPFYPFFFFKEIVLIGVVFALVGLVLAVFFPPGLEDLADPADNLYVPKPEWYFLSLYQLLKYLPGKLEVMGTVLVPAGGFALLLLLPFLDKNPVRAPSRRPVAMAVMLSVVVVVVLLTVLGFLS